MANWITEKIKMACGHMEETRIPHPAFEGEQIQPEMWRKQIATTPCQECFKLEEAASSGRL